MCSDSNGGLEWSIGKLNNKTRKAGVNVNYSFWRSTETIESLKNALRAGMVNAWKKNPELQSVKISGTERTLYPLIRDRTIDYLKSKGYDYLTKYENLFVIGDVSIYGTNKKADCFINDPERGMPIFAIEIKIGDSKQFYFDLKKSKDIWGKLDLAGVFILLFETSSKDSVAYLDGAELNLPFSPYNTRIYPLIMPTTSDIDHCCNSLTSLDYLSKHKNSIVFPYLHIEDGRNDSIGTKIEKTLIKNKKIPLIYNLNLEPKSIDSINVNELLTQLERFPPKIIGYSPMDQVPTKETIPKKLWEAINELLEKGTYLLVFGDWMDADSHNDPSSLWGQMPVELYQKEKGYNKVTFGEEIKVNSSFEEFKEIENIGLTLKGFVKCKLRNDGRSDILAEINFENEKYPFIVEYQKNNRKSIFIGGGIGGWGSKWRTDKKAVNIFWLAILKKLLYVK